MANPDINYGLRPVRRIDGMPWNNSLRRYVINAASTNYLYVGDGVIKAAGSADASGVPGIVRATYGSGDKLTGVLCGWDVTPAMPFNNGPFYRAQGAKSAAMYALVCDDPSVLFAIEANANLTAADIGKNANLVATTTGNPYTGLSGVQVSVTSVGTAAAKQLRLVELLQEADNVAGTHAKVLVAINQHTEVPGAAGI